MLSVGLCHSLCGMHVPATQLDCLLKHHMAPEVFSVLVRAYIRLLNGATCITAVTCKAVTCKWLPAAISISKGTEWIS